MNQNHKYAIYGSTDFALILEDILLQSGMTCIGFIDDYSPGKVGVLGSFETFRQGFKPADCSIIIGIGYKHMQARWDIYCKVLEAGYQVPSLIHPKAYVRHQEYVDSGAVIMAASVVDMRSRIGALSVIWPAAVVNHDSTVGENCFISPNVTICGFVNIGRNSFIGAGSVIVDHKTVPPNSFIKASSVFSGIS